MRTLEGALHAPPDARWIGLRRHVEAMGVEGAVSPKSMCHYDVAGGDVAGEIVIERGLVVDDESVFTAF
jgi:hypothetical protein